MRNPTKFGSPKMDTSSSRYEFLKHTFKYVKNKLENQTSYRLTAEARGQQAPTRQQYKTGDDADRWELADGEVSGDSVFTTILSSPTCIER